MITAEQNRLNLASARNVVMSSLATTPEALRTDYAMRNAYNLALASYIASNPARFTAATVATAQNILSRGYQPLQDESYDFSIAAESIANTTATFGFSVATAVTAGVALLFLGRLIK